METNSNIKNNSSAKHKKVVLATPSQNKPDFVRSGSLETFDNRHKPVTVLKKTNNVPFKIPIRAQSDSPRDITETARSFSAEGVRPRNQPLKAANSSIFML